jgi:4-carboxymuconolactone decarboxylase
MNGRIAIIGGVLAATLLTAAALISNAAQQGAANSVAAKRVEPFSRPTARRIPTGGGGQAPCPDNLDMCRKFSAFTSHFVANYRIPLRDKELLILRTAWLSRGEFAWSRHHVTGKKAGLTDDEIARITRGPDAKGWSDFEGLLLKTADELHTTRFISDATWKSLAQRYSDDQLLEVVLIVGNYTILSMYQNTIGIQLEPGLMGFPDENRDAPR